MPGKGEQWFAPTDDRVIFRHFLSTNVPLLGTNVKVHKLANARNCLKWYNQHMTSCINHPDTRALATCQVCHRPLCAVCIKQDGARVLCTSDYYASAPERVKVEPYLGTIQPLPPATPSDAKIVPTLPEALPPTRLPHQADTLAAQAEIFIKQQGPVELIGAVCAVFGAWFGIQLVNENGRTMQATPYWLLALLLAIAFVGFISSIVALRQDRAFDTRIVVRLSLVLNLLVVFGTIVAFVIFS